MEKLPQRTHGKASACLFFRFRMPPRLSSLRKAKRPQKVITSETRAIAASGWKRFRGCLSTTRGSDLKLNRFFAGKTLLFNTQARLQAPSFAFGAVQTSKMTPHNDKICHRDAWCHNIEKGGADA